MDTRTLEVVQLDEDASAALEAKVAAVAAKQRAASSLTHIPLSETEVASVGRMNRRQRRAFLAARLRQLRHVGTT